MPAQGTLCLSNLSETSGGNAAVASDSWIAQRFYTGPHPGGYILNSVQLLMTTASSSPSGFSVSICAFESGIPGNNVDSLSGLNPFPGGIFTFTGSSVALAPSTFYFIVTTAAAPVAEGAFYWSKAGTPDFSSFDSWSLASFSLSSADGSAWQTHRLAPAQFAIYASAVPEPSVTLLAGLGLVGLLFWQHRRRPARQSAGTESARV